MRLLFTTTSCCSYRKQPSHDYLIILIIVLQLVALSKSLIKIPDIFNERVLPYTQRNGQLIEQLGRIIKLDTFLSPKDWETFSTKFQIFTRRKTNSPIAFSSRRYCFPDTCYGPYQYNIFSMAESGFNINLRTIVLISGYLTTDYVEWMTETKNLWLQLEDVNVIIVTWKSANRYLYSTAVADTPLVARQITIFLYYLAELNGSSLSDLEFTKRLHFIGHSLGAHVSGFVGQDLAGRLGRITGLDPAGLSFDMMPRSHRLDLEDALLVDVIHTNSGKLRYINAAATALASAIDLGLGKTPLVNKLTRALTDQYSGEGDTVWYGIESPIGHVDYYANNGRIQPGCSGMLRVCDHGRSNEIFQDVLRHELALRNHYQITHELINLETQQAKEREKVWLKQNRLLAFKAEDYSSFLTGEAFKLNCPSVINGRQASSSEVNVEVTKTDDHVVVDGRQVIDESFKHCSIPIDVLTPVEELIQELKVEYNVSFDNELGATQERNHYYFKTHSQRPLVGDHNLLKVRLDPASTSWNKNCLLSVQVRMISGEMSNLELNKDFHFVSSGAGDNENNNFFGIAVPFVNPNGYEARLALNVILMAIRNNQTIIDEHQLISLISQVIPYNVELSISGSLSTGVLEAIGSRVWNLSFRSKPSKKCRLMVESIEIHPIIGHTQNIAGLYGSMGSLARLYNSNNNIDIDNVNDNSNNVASKTLPVLTPAAHAALIKHPQLLSADGSREASRLTRTLDALVLG